MRSPRSRVGSLVDRTLRRRVAGALGGLACVALVASTACVTPRTGEIEPRYVAVHNALAAMGLAETGPLLQGSLAEGREARFVVELARECTTLTALGGPGIRDLDLTLLDPEGKPVAHDTTEEPQAVVRACVDRAGRYVLVVRAGKGAGDFLATTWVGGVASPAPAASAAQVAEGQGTCDAPLPLTAGTVRGSTARAEAENEGSCSASTAPEMVYRLDVTARQRVRIEVDPRFDSVLYLRRGECADADTEVACNDDAPHEHSSRIDEVLEPGTYFAFVDGYQSASGMYRMTTTISEAPTPAELCQRARSLVPAAAPTAASLQDEFDHVQSTCGQGAHGPDTAYRLHVTQPSRARITMRSDDFPPVLHMRKTCADAASEVGCADDAIADGAAVLSATLDPGDYGVFADAVPADAHGHYTVAAEITSAQGTGVAGDACADALPLGPHDAEISGDTFAARDDVAGSCGGAGAADVVYRIDVPRRARLEVDLAAEEGEHVLVLGRTCGDRASEIACGPRVREVLAPGSYTLAVDGKKAGVVGRFVLHVALRDAVAQEAACRATPELRLGEVVRATTAGGSDKYRVSCALPADAQRSPDRLYRLVVPRRQRVHLEVTTAHHNAVLAVRSTCLDGGASATELACARGGPAGHPALDADLAAGTYYVVVDGLGADASGPFNLEARAAP